MGVGIYLKPANKDGRSLIYIRVKKGSKVFRKTTSIKVKPSDWDSRTFQVSPKVDNSIFINEKLDDISTRLKRVGTFLNQVIILGMKWLLIWVAILIRKKI